MAVLKKLIYLSLFVFPLGVVIRIKIFGNSAVYPLDLVVMLSSFVFVYESLIRKVIPAQKITIPLIIFLLWAAVSFIINAFWLNPSQIMSSFLYWIRLVLYLLFFMGVLSLGKKEKRRLLVGMIISSVIFALFSAVQYIFYPNLAYLHYLGWDDHLFRVFSTMLDPNFTGVLLSCISILLLGLGFAWSNKKVKLGIFVLFVICVMLLFLTYSRTAYVTFLVSFTTFFLLLRKAKYIVFLVAIFVLGLVLIPKDLHSEGVDLLRTNSVYARLSANQDAIEIFKQSPIYGVGYNTLRFVRENKSGYDASQFEDHSLSGFPNSYLYVLSTTGIIGLIIFLFFLINTMLVVKSQEAKDHYQTISGIIAISTLVGVMAGSLFENLFFYIFVQYWLFLVIAIAYEKD